MKKLVVVLMIAYTIIGYGQVPTYYNDVDLTLSGQSLKTELSTKITVTHTTFLSYSPGVWDALKQSDVSPINSSKVILVYGYSDTDGNSLTDRTRGVNDNGGSTSDWNREHVFPKSLGNPNLGTSGPGSDAHHLRPSDTRMNSTRSNRKFADGSGNSGITSQGHWYPGDEFKGDVARMMMYMYLRYGNRCLPSNVGIGNSVSGDANMIQLFLEWNAEDPVSALELQRNPILENLQGNRNPFIDNPAFATKIWGGPQAEDRFGNDDGGGDDDNGGGDDQNISCVTTVSTFPYSEDFERTFGNWKQAIIGDDFDWTNNSYTTPSNGTGPSTASSGTYYVYMESSSPNNSRDRAILYSPCYDLSGENQANFSFKYHMYGSSSMGSLKLEASLNGTSWTTIWSKSGNQGNSWATATVNLEAYLDKKVQLRFNGITGTTWQGDMAIDAVRLSTSGNGGDDDTDVPSTTAAINLSITFDNYSEETSWEIRNNENRVVYSGGAYGSNTSGSTINLSRTLEQGCYTLIFKDTYGDGICCAYGNGSYRLSNVTTGSILASGGDFASQETTNFCVGTNSRTIAKVEEVEKRKNRDFDFEFYPNPVYNKMIISNLNSSAIMNYKITNYTGQVIKKAPMYGKEIRLEKLQSGMYFITIVYNDIEVTKKFIKK